MQEFREAPHAWDITAAHEGVTILENPHGLIDRFPVKAPNGATTEHNKSEYIVLNALGSSELADGKYLYSPATHRIEVQWIPGIGSEKAAAPQARLMATVINGILSRKLPWGLVLVGVFLVIGVELLGVRSLTFAVGAYLSIGTTLAYLRRRRCPLPRRLRRQKGGRYRRRRYILRVALRLRTDRRRRHHGPSRRHQRLAANEVRLVKPHRLAAHLPL